jgi:hypothetical protein
MTDETVPDVDTIGESASPPKRKFPSLAEREAAARNRVEREHVDFVGVKEHHMGVHDRLLNWASWCRSRGAPNVAPGFELHQSDNWDKREYGAATVVGVDKMDAAQVAKAVARLPEKHRRAVQWYYTQRGMHPLAKARELAVSVRSLRELLDDARQMLVNWRV